MQTGALEITPVALVTPQETVYSYPSERRVLRPVAQAPRPCGALEDLGTEDSGPSTSPSGRSPPTPRPNRRFPAATPAAGSGVRPGFELPQALVQAGGQLPRTSCAKTDGQVGGLRPGLRAEPRPGAETSLQAWRAGRAVRRCRGRGRAGCQAGGGDRPGGPRPVGVLKGLGGVVTGLETHRRGGRWP